MMSVGWHTMILMLLWYNSGGRYSGSGNDWEYIFVSCMAVYMLARCWLLAEILKEGHAYFSSRPFR